MRMRRMVMKEDMNEDMNEEDGRMMGIMRMMIAGVMVEMW